MTTKKLRSKRDANPLLRFLQLSARNGFKRAYLQVRLDPEKYREQVRRRTSLPLKTWEDARYLDERVLAPHANRIISQASRTAALEGLGLGVGGFSTLIPDMGLLSAITVRMLQRLSLIYGFEYTTDDEIAGFWLAAATAAGVDLGRDFLEKQAVERMVPLLVDRIAMKVGAEAAEKWAARIVPIVSAGAAAAINYYFVRAWGRRAQQHFLDRRRSLRTLVYSAHEPSPGLRLSLGESGMN